MRKIFVMGVLAFLARGAQSQAPTAAEIEAIDAASRTGLRGIEEISAPSLIQSPEPKRNRPAADSVSTAELRHKPTRNAQKFVTRGVQLSQAGDHPRAAEEFEKAVAADPGFARAYRGLGLEHAQLERYAEAETELLRSLTLDPESWIGHYNLAVVLYKTQDLPAAERCLRRALELSSANVQVHTLLGQVLWRRLETRAEALEHLQYAARTSSEASELLASLKGSSQ